MMSPPESAGRLPELIESIENDLRASTHVLREKPHQEMSEMIEYHLGWQDKVPEGHGKRMRPLLTLLCCQAAGGDWRQALPAATCIELIHNFSLVHDDIQDRSDMRRGKPAIWKRWGEAQGINIGDAIFVLARLAAQRLLATETPPAAILHILGVIDEECLNLTKGQYLDLAFERRERVSEDEYLEMVSGKTCALMRASTQSGAIVAGAGQQTIDQLREFGHQLGLAFQIVDDILGIWGETAVTGKSNESDLLHRKKSLPVLYGLDESPEFSAIWSSEHSGAEDIRAMRQALEAAGAHVYAQQKAAEATARATRALSEAGIEHRAAAEELAGIAGSMLARAR